MKHLFLILLCSILLAGCSGSYDGMTAEEWHDEYSQADYDYRMLKDCVETYSYYYSSDDYEDLQDALDNVAGCL